MNDIIDIRTGIGNDIHRLVEGRKLILGGLEIPYELGLLGHSDGDVVIHAIIDALLGAAGLGDIGEMFPDTDFAYKDINSKKLLKRVIQLIENKHFQIRYIDVIIQAQQPKLKDYKSSMCNVLAEIIGIDVERINIKAKTNEGLDAIGRAEAIASVAVATLVKV